MNNKIIDTDALLAGVGDEVTQVTNSSQAQASSGAHVELPAERVMSGNKHKDPAKKRVMVLDLDPRVCRRWKYYDRFEEWFSYENCRDLIDDMREREQEIPGIVRKLHNDPDGFEYEVVFGGRRHYSADYITENDGKVKHFKAILRDISDQEAARLMDLENRKRQDISDFERCVSYRQQLGKAKGSKPIFKTLNELIDVIESDKGDSGSPDRKRLTKGALSQMVQAAELNEIPELISLFTGRRIHIPWTHAYNVMMLWSSGKPGVKEAVLLKAKQLQDGSADNSPEKILKDLQQAVVDKGKAPAPKYYKEDIALSNGQVAVKASTTAKDLSLKIPLKVLENSSQKELLELIKRAMSSVTA